MLTYWTAVYTEETWRESAQHGHTVMGYPERTWTATRGIKERDTLICYVLGMKRFVGALQVLSTAFRDDTPVWKSGVFPARVRVRPIVALETTQGVPFDDIRDALQFYRRAKNPGGWGTQFQNPPRRIDDADAIIIEQALRGRRPTKDEVARISEHVATEYTAANISEDLSEGSTPAHPIDPPISPLGEATEVEPTALPMREHDHMQWLLLNTGSQIGLDVWAARNDRGRSWNGRRFADVSRIQASLPNQFEPQTQRIVELIDVLWLQGSGISSAFEIEHTTSIYSGILRMADLVTLQPNINIKLFLVSPDERRIKVRDELNRPTFKSLGLNTRCKLITFQTLEERLDRLGDDIRHMRPDFIDSLAESCEA